ncbi:MAG: SIS domain-containing protein [Nitrosarchaeum sp.]|nr:SIS domain-containing protein [Nitrosarchaeum sp.]
MIDLSSLKQFDSKGMYQVYDKWNQISRESYNADYEIADFSDIDNIVFAGMGGSGAIGDFLSSILSNDDIHVSVTKGYHLPKTVDSKTLVITTSISGDTDETLSVLDSAKKTDCKIIAFSSGGKMESFCSKNSIEHRKIPAIHSPRASFVVYLYSILKILGPITPVSKHDIEESFTKMDDTKNKISSSNLTESNPALSLARWIDGIPLIYYPWGLQPAAIRFKNMLQENSKTHAIAEDVVEACHNGIVSWEKHSNVVPILLRGKDDYIKTKERWDILKEYFEEAEIPYREIFSVDGSIFSKLINLIYLLDYSTIYYSIRQKVNPSTVDSIKFVKERL